MDEALRTPTTVTIAPDAFKGTASAEQAATWIGEGVREILKDATIKLAPMADGGEGTSELFKGERITLPTTDAAGRLTEATTPMMPLQPQRLSTSLPPLGYPPSQIHQFR